MMSWKSDSQIKSSSKSMSWFERHPRIAQLFARLNRSGYQAMNSILNIASSWATALTLALFTLFLGVIASAKLSSIGKPLNEWLDGSTNFANTVYAMMRGDAAVFYSSLLVFSALFGLREIALARKIKIRERELVSLIRTMPPRKMLSVLQAAYEEILDYVNLKVKCVDDVNMKKQEIDNAIRYCLDSLTVLTKEFQRSSNTARYAANVMLYVDISNVTPKRREELLKKMDPFVDVQTFDGLRGVLELAANLSASTDNPEDSFATDEYLEEICLPVPRDQWSRHNRMQRFLAGAPEALFKGNYLIDDTHRLLQYYDQSRKYDIARSIFENADYYFKKTDNGTKVRSFFSKRLSTREPGHQKPVAIGVVNVHSSEPNIFVDNETFQSFQQLIYPVLEVLTQLLVDRRDLASARSTL